MASVRVQGVTKCGRIFFSRAQTYSAGVKALENWAKGPVLGFGTAGLKEQPKKIEFISFERVEEDPGHGPEVDLSPAALRK